MTQDMAKVLAIGERIRKDMLKRELNVLNIYVSQFPPVDDYEFRINKPIVHPQSKKTEVKTILVDRARADEKIIEIEELFSRPKQITRNIPVEPSYEEVEDLRRLTLKTAVDRTKEEKAIFKAGKPFFTYLFIAIQLIVFAVMEFF